ncbi:unnamed protein product [Amoebophrya sp. A120]|nr:unnamed protein product [Amoebophrya sp. A120]|eukprot:GSA120T00001471001.1
MREGEHHQSSPSTDGGVKMIQHDDSMFVRELTEKNLNGCVSANVGTDEAALDQDHSKFEDCSISPDDVTLFNKTAGQHGYTKISSAEVLPPSLRDTTASEENPDTSDARENTTNTTTASTSTFNRTSEWYKNNLYRGREPDQLPVAWEPGLTAADFHPAETEEEFCRRYTYWRFPFITADGRRKTLQTFGADVTEESLLTVGTLGGARNNNSSSTNAAGAGPPTKAGYSSKANNISVSKHELLMKQMLCFLLKFVCNREAINALPIVKKKAPWCEAVTPLATAASIQFLGGYENVALRYLKLNSWRLTKAKLSLIEAIRWRCVDLPRILLHTKPSSEKNTTIFAPALAPSALRGRSASRGSKSGPNSRGSTKSKSRARSGSSPRSGKEREMNRVEHQSRENSAAAGGAAKTNLLEQMTGGLSTTVTTPVATTPQPPEKAFVGEHLFSRRLFPIMGIPFVEVTPLADIHDLVQNPDRLNPKSSYRTAGAATIAVSAITPGETPGGAATSQLELDLLMRFESKTKPGSGTPGRYNNGTTAGGPHGRTAGAPEGETSPDSSPTVQPRPRRSMLARCWGSLSPRKRKLRSSMSLGSTPTPAMSRGGNSSSTTSFYSSAVPHPSSFAAKANGTNEETTTSTASSSAKGNGNGTSSAQHLPNGAAAILEEVDARSETFSFVSLTDPQPSPLGPLRGEGSSGVSRFNASATIITETEEEQDVGAVVVQPAGGASTNNDTSSSTTANNTNARPVGSSRAQSKSLLNMLSSPISSRATPKAPSSMTTPSSAGGNPYQIFDQGSSGAGGAPQLHLDPALVAEIAGGRIEAVLHNPKVVPSSPSSSASRVVVRDDQNAVSPAATTNSSSSVSNPKIVLTTATKGLGSSTTTSSKMETKPRTDPLRNVKIYLAYDGSPVEYWQLKHLDFETMFTEYSTEEATLVYVHYLEAKERVCRATGSRQTTLLLDCAGVSMGHVATCTKFMHRFNKSCLSLGDSFYPDGVKQTWLVNMPYAAAFPLKVTLSLLAQSTRESVRAFTRNSSGLPPEILTLLPLEEYEALTVPMENSVI